jgi:AcrR family transcriptional regulator
MPSRQEQKAATRRRLLRHAERLVIDRGFAETRTVDVAHAAGVAHGSVFVHFQSREELMLAVATEMGRKLTDRLHALAAAGSGLRNALDTHLEYLAEHEDLYRRLLIDGPGLPAEFRTMWLGMQSAIASYLLAAAEVDVQAGRLRPTPGHLFFNTWLGLVHHYVLNRDIFASGASVLAEHGPELRDHYLSLLTPQTALTP